MRLPKPQDLPPIFAKAKDEKNWLIFAVGKADERGKRPKRPVARDKPYIWVNRDKAASFTYDKAVERLKWFRDNYDLDVINKKAEARRLSRDKPGPQITVEEYVLGYFAREDSALIALDFDNVAHKGEVEDFELMDRLEKTGAYAEISSSGTGVRVLMPRDWGDEGYHAGEKNDVGLFVSAKGAACALTFDTITSGEMRDQALFDLVLERHGAVREEEHKRDTASVEAQVLEHGRIEVEVFREIVANVENDDRFDEWGKWGGMVWAAREYYEVVDPDRLDEVREIVEAWSEAWPGGHDTEVFEEVWERKPRAGEKAGLGSWLHYALEAGWVFPRPAAKPWHKFPEPPAKMETPEDFFDRFVIIDGAWFDRLHHKNLRSIDAIGHHISDLSWPKVKNSKGAKVTPSATQRYDLARKGAKKFTGGAFLPGEGPLIEGRMPDAAGHMVPVPGAEVFNLWQPPNIPTTPQPVPTTWINHVQRLYPEEHELIFDYQALKVQTNKIGFALVLGGTPGAGKDLLLRPLVRALSPHAAGSVDIGEMDKDFPGDIIAEKTLIVIQEANSGQGARMLRSREALFRSLIAIGEPFVANRKHKPQAPIPNVADYVFTMNEIGGLHIPVDDRRYCVAYTEAEAMTESDYEAYQRAYEGDAAVVAWLARRRCKLKPGQPAPMTTAKKAAQASSLSRSAKVIAEKVKVRVKPLAWITVDSLASEFGVEFAEAGGDPTSLHSEIGNILASIGWRHSRHWKRGRAEIGGHKITVWEPGFSDHPHIWSKEEIRASLKRGEEFGRCLKEIRPPLTYPPTTHRGDRNNENKII